MLVVVDNGVIRFEEGPTIRLEEWAPAILMGWELRHQDDARERVLSMLQDPQKSDVKRVLDWLRNNQRRFEDWAAKNPETYKAIKGVLKFFAWLLGIDIVLPD